MKLWTRGTLPLILLALALGAPAGAADVYLWAGPTNLTMPDGTVVPMWGYAEEPDGDFTTLEGTVTVPGPVIRVPHGDPVLTIHLHNTLPSPVSVVIPGQVTQLTPETFTDPQGRQRIRSFAPETAPGATTTSTWSSISPGTYLYHSGTQPQVQVQMGLYGCVVQDVQRLARAPIGEAYPGVLYDNEAILVYSEIDPALHAAVIGGTYGPGGAMTSTLGYTPQYFLINGNAFPQAAPMLDHNVTRGERVLVRMVNAGLRTHTPIFQGLQFQVLAEDGNPFPYPFVQHALVLPAGKTHDLLLETPRSGVFPVWDHSLALTNGTAPSGGMLVHLVVSAPDGSPQGVPDAFFTQEDQQLVTAAPGVLANDSDGGLPGLGPLTVSLVSAPPHGTVTLAADGSFTYDPEPDFNGSDLFTYTVNDGSFDSDPVAAVIQIASVDDAPVGVADAYSLDEDTDLVLAVPGVLANDQDVEGDPLTASLATGPAHGTLSLAPDGSLTYTPDSNYFGPDGFSYTAGDGLLSSAAAAVSLDVVPVNDVPVTLPDAATTAAATPVTIPVLDNDTDIDGTITPSTVAVVSGPANGIAVANADGTVAYTPDAGFTCQDGFTYTVQDDELGLSAETQVTVDVFGGAGDTCFLQALDLADLLAAASARSSVAASTCGIDCALDLIFQ